MVPIVIEPSAFTVTAIVAWSPEASLTVIVAVPGATDVTSTVLPSLEIAAVATDESLEEAEVPTNPKAPTLFCVLVSVVALNDVLPEPVLPEPVLPEPVLPEPVLPEPV